jgi:hypothetical protein
MTDYTPPKPKFNANVYTPEDYTRILTGIGAKATPENIKLMQSWRNAEGGTHNNNPFNTTQNWAGASGGGVKRYQTRQQGIDATVDTLVNAGARTGGRGYYSGVVSGFRTNNPAKTAQAIVASPWAASHYGGDWQSSNIWKGYTGKRHTTSSEIGSAGVGNAASSKTNTANDYTIGRVNNFASAYKNPFGAF